MDAIAEIARTGVPRSPADFVDGTAFSPSELYLTVGALQRQVAPWLSDYTGQQIYYKSIRPDGKTSSRSTTTCGAGTPTGSGARARSARRSRGAAAVAAPVPAQRRVPEAGRLRPRHGLSDALTPARQARARAVIQDVEIPVERGAEFLGFRAARRDEPGMDVPAAAARRAVVAALPAGAGRGLRQLRVLGYGAAARGPRDGYYNRLVEEEVGELDGHKSLYSTAFYPRTSSGSEYNGDAYDKLKAPTTATGAAHPVREVRPRTLKALKHAESEGKERYDGSGASLRADHGPDAPVEFAAFDGSHARALPARRSSSLSDRRSPSPTWLRRPARSAWPGPTCPVTSTSRATCTGPGPDVQGPEFGILARPGSCACCRTWAARSCCCTGCRRRRRRFRRTGAG
jgi:hypothetical protein